MGSQRAAGGRSTIILRVPVLAARAVLGVLSCALAACSFDPAGPAGAGDVDADVVAIDGAATDDAVAIDAAAPVDGAACVARCDGATLVTCTGSAEVRTPCDLGCSTTGTPHCATIDPSNLPDTSDLAGVTGALAFVAGERHYIDTDTGEIYYIANGDVDTKVVLRAAGTGLVAGINFRALDATTAVLAVSSFDLAAGMTFEGYGARGLILLSAGPVAIGGTIDWTPAICSASGVLFSINRRCGGPGAGSGGTRMAPAGTGCAGGAGGTGGGGDDIGGAGGGMGTAGARGGGTPTKPAAVPAALTACPGPTLEPLRGGSGGGAGSPSGMSYGGGGGGALQITSLASIRIGNPAAAQRAQIYAGGAGGKGTLVTNGGGGGGGSGGAILLEAPAVTVINADLIASGGGGAGGRLMSSASQVTTADGGWASVSGAATGGVGDVRGGAGGAGAFNGAAAGEGGGGLDGTGGGGGGLGRIRINTRDGTVTATMSAYSGEATLGTIATR